MLTLRHLWNWMEGLVVSEANLKVYIHPSKCKDVRQAILQQLSSLLFMYDENFEGVILAYEVCSLSKKVKILPGLHPDLGVRLRANLLLFSPRPNMFLEGKVVKLKTESIHVNVLSISSASISMEDIRKEFKFKTKHGVKMFASMSDKRHVIKVGSMIRFAVKSFDEETLHISGSLLPLQTGCIRWLSKHGPEDVSQVSRSVKKRMTRDLEMGNQEQDPGLVTHVDSSSRKSRKIGAEE